MKEKKKITLEQYSEPAKETWYQNENGEWEMKVDRRPPLKSLKFFLYRKDIQLGIHGKNIKDVKEQFKLAVIGRLYKTLSVLLDLDDITFELKDMPKEVQEALK